MSRVSFEQQQDLPALDQRGEKDTFPLKQRSEVVVEFAHKAQELRSALMSKETKYTGERDLA